MDKKARSRNRFPKGGKILRSLSRAEKTLSVDFNGKPVVLTDNERDIKLLESLTGTGTS